MYSIRCRRKDSKLLEQKWWNGNEEEIKRVGEYEFDVKKYFE